MTLAFGQNQNRASTQHTMLRTKWSGPGATLLDSSPNIAGQPQRHSPVPRRSCVHNRITVPPPD